MEKVEWDNTLSVGVKLIDEQHKGLIQRINGVLKAVEEKQEEREIAKTLNFLFDYTHFHFSTEVKHMELNDYPGLEDHKMRHEEFVDTLKNLEKEFKEEGATKLLAGSVKTLLMSWLVEHVQNVDQEFGRFLRGKNITITEEG